MKTELKKNWDKSTLVNKTTQAINELVELVPILCNNSYVPTRNAAKAVDFMKPRLATKTKMFKNVLKCLKITRNKITKVRWKLRKIVRSPKCLKITNVLKITFVQNHQKYMLGTRMPAKIIGRVLCVPRVPRVPRVQCVPHVPCVFCVPCGPCGPCVPWYGTRVPSCLD